jgi:hypothetical protein
VNLFISSSTNWTLLPKPSPKRALYFQFFEKHLHLSGHSYAQNIKLAKPEAKFKKELAKPGKFGRLYVTYGESIIQMGWFFNYFKSYFCVKHYSELEHCNLELEVVKSLDEKAGFDSNPPIGLSGKVFSDDMSFQYKTDNVHLLFDADISSCDSGNTLANFYLLGAILCRMGATLEMVRTSFARLREPIMMRNPSEPSEYLEMKPKTIFQGSGCPETTSVNNIASTSIALAFQSFIHYYNQHDFQSQLVKPSGTKAYNGSFDDAPREVQEEILQLAAASVGHVITIEWHDKPEQLQFLKYSPALTDSGTWTLFRNLGAILRSFGTCDGDITAKMLNVTNKQFSIMSLEDKMEQFMNAIVCGLVNEPKHIIMDALRARFPNKRHKIASSYHDTEFRGNLSVPLSSLQNRYGGEEAEWHYLAAQIKEMKLGTHAPSDLVARIMKIDYGLPI